VNPGPALPIIDVGAFSRSTRKRSAAIRAVTGALTRSGFMYVTGHGIDPLLIERAFAAMRGFFGQTHAIKARYAYRNIDANFGYQRIETERLNPHSMPDLKESFTMRNALAHADETARWPEGDFRDAALALYAGALGAAYRVLEVLAACLKLPAGYFAQRHRGENVTLRFLHYPAGLLPRSSAQLGAGAHTDYGSITLLFQDQVGGLEVLRADGTWQQAVPVQGAALINTGDLMERWTNGRFRSTIHRVAPIGGTRDRHSIALFVDPDAAVEVDCFASCVSAERPAQYPRITAGEHIRRKIAATNEWLK